MPLVMLDPPPTCGGGACQLVVCPLYVPLDPPPPPAVDDALDVELTLGSGIGSGARRKRGVRPNGPTIGSWSIAG